MNGKKFILGILVGICSVVMLACGSSNQKTSKAEPDQKETITPDNENDWDFSEQISDLSVIKEQVITTACVNVGGLTRLTSDEIIVQNIIDQICSLDLKENNEKNGSNVDGFGILRLMNGNQVVYDIHISDRIYIGDKFYGTKEDADSFWSEVIGYCRQTFFYE